jgi:hypothetical protein
MEAAAFAICMLVLERYVRSKSVGDIIERALLLE